jgi:hypothetical protein
LSKAFSISTERIMWILSLHLFMYCIFLWIYVCWPREEYWY